MLADFIVANRSAIITHSQRRLASRMTPKSTEAELKDGIPVFVDQLTEALRLAESSDVIDHEQMQASAGRHGESLHRLGLTVGQVVHDYGDVCQAVTELAVQKGAPIPGCEFQTLNLCLDDAIAGAVTGFAGRRESAIADLGSERLAVLAHGLRSLLNTAMISFESIKSGRVTASGSTGSVHERSLMGLRDLLDRSLADVRLEAGSLPVELIAVTEFIEEIEIGALLQAKAFSIPFAIISPVDRTLTIEGDRQTLAAALANLLNNAFTFAREKGTVSLTTRAAGDRVLFEIHDQCGSLPEARIDELMRPLDRRDADRKGPGLGLSIARKAARANGGEVRVHNSPGKGCVFTLDLPRKQPRRTAAMEKTAEERALVTPEGA